MSTICHGSENPQLPCKISFQGRTDIMMFSYIILLSLHYLCQTQRQLITNKKLTRKMSKGIEQIKMLKKAKNKLF